MDILKYSISLKQNVVDQLFTYSVSFNLFINITFIIELFLVDFDNVANVCILITIICQLFFGSSSGIMLIGHSKCLYKSSNLYLRSYVKLSKAIPKQFQLKHLRLAMFLEIIFAKKKFNFTFGTTKINSKSLLSFFVFYSCLIMTMIPLIKNNLNTWYNTVSNDRNFCEIKKNEINEFFHSFTFGLWSKYRS